MIFFSFTQFNAKEVAMIFPESTRLRERHVDGPLNGSSFLGLSWASLGLHEFS